jgi:hypothetical protein
MRRLCEGALMKLENIIDTLAYFDPVDRIEGVAFTFWNAEWRKAYRRRGVVGIVIEFWRCVFSRNTTEHELKRGSISGADIEAMLKRHGVKLGDRSFGRDNQHLSFVTKKRQARWAEYLMERYGVDVTSTFDARNRGWASKASAERGREPRGAKTNLFRVLVREVVSFGLIVVVLIGIVWAVSVFK